MDEEKLIEQLKRFKPIPRKSWQEATLSSFRNLVTTEHKIRNSQMNIFNFLNIFIVNPKIKITLAVVTVIALLIAGGGTVYASDSANPGDFLYSVDKAAESVQRTFISDSVARSEFEIAVMNERVLELSKLSEENNSDTVSRSISEVEVQQLRLRERLQEMDQLRIENKLQTQEQQKVMEKLQEITREHEETINQIQTKLKSKGDFSNSENLMEVKNKYSEEMGNQIQNFETETGVQVRENEQEQNEGDTQNQEQNQNQNQNSGGN
ncbi:hypothetical protein JW796_00525 [Candidatus Dojkabacteria bacterium]|nr:hypothetical protein [Candidatus Dojkabacteria bacterium]